MLFYVFYININSPLLRLIKPPKTSPNLRHSQKLLGPIPQQPICPEKNVEWSIGVYGHTWYSALPGHLIVSPAKTQVLRQKRAAVNGGSSIYEIFRLLTSQYRYLSVKHLRLPYLLPVRAGARFAQKFSCPQPGPPYTLGLESMVKDCQSVRPCCARCTFTHESEYSSE